MNSFLTLAKGLEQKSKTQQQSTDEMLKTTLSEHGKSVRTELNENEKGISATIFDHSERLSAIMSQRTKGMLRMVSQTWLTIVLVSMLLTAPGASTLWWQGQQILDDYTTIREQEYTQAMLSERSGGVQFSTYGEQKRRCVRVNPETGRFREDSSWVMLTGRQHMVELEKQLLSALERLQQGYSERLGEWESAFAEWWTMSGLMQRENAALSERVTGLSRQVRSLSGRLRRLSQGRTWQRHVVSRDERRSIRKRWGWNDLSDSEYTMVHHFESARRKSMSLLFLAYRFSSRT